ncbi:MAG: cytochrome, partial [Pseudomonadota bacterium]
RYLEKRDSSQDEPPIDPDVVAEMARTEDWVSQNHMGSIVHIRPGVLRTTVVKAGHRGLGLLLRVKATDGYLGSMRTVHFAHWAFLNNSSRLLFFSNFDQSWGSYLDDFIEKAHVGLTLAWGCGVGFPPTRFLIYDGASHGRRFKNWALSSRAVSRFWYSAYPDLTVDQIERNYRVAQGLRRTEMDSDEIVSWMRDL